MSDFDQPYFKDAEAARIHLESIRWPDGPFCPHCGSTSRINKLEGKSHRPGLFKCYDCNGHFTVTVGTLFERSKVPLHKWFMAVYWLCSSKKGMSSHQMHRMLGVTYKTAWFMTHRIREAMKGGGPFAGPMGGKDKVVEADETYLGGNKGEWEFRTNIGWRRKRGYGGKRAIVSLVERGGRVRSFHVDKANGETIREILFTNVSRETRLMTDEAQLYKAPGRQYASHERVTHSIREYVRDDVHTNTIEGYFSIFKRGMKGIYQHCGERHLHRYLGEFDFRYNARDVTDWERAVMALKGIEGKRLTYGQPCRQS